MPERYPGLHFALIEFNAHWLSSLARALREDVFGAGSAPGFECSVSPQCR